MCDMPVFATSDITPEHWADFVKTVELTQDIGSNLPRGPSFDPTPPYTLVYSRTQEDFSKAVMLAQRARTEFSDASFAELHAFVQVICKTNRQIISTPFMVLDKQSEGDRKVVLIQKSLRTLHAEDENEEIGYKGEDEITWRKHRVPFENADFLSNLIMAQPGDEGDEFLQNTAYKTIDGL